MTVLVLDCDGVVVCGHPEGGRWDKDLARDLGLSAAVLQERFFARHWRRIEIGEADLFAVLEEVWPQLGCAASPHALVDYWFAKDSRIDAAVIAEVDRWRAAGGKAFLATVQERHRAKHLWETLALGTHFDGLLYSAALGARKPDAAFFERAQARLPVAEAREILFGDDRRDNVEAARAQGWQAFLHAEIGDLQRAIASAGAPWHHRVRPAT